MKYLLLTSHATLAQGIAAALEMLMGPRDYVIVCGMQDTMGPDEFQAQVAQAIAPVTADDEVVLLADIAGGSPYKCARAALVDKGLADKAIAFGGANLPMAISALMGIEDDLDLDAMRDAMLSEGTQAIRQL